MSWMEELEKGHKEFSPDEYRMAEKHLKKCSTSLVIREMQIKTTLRCPLTPVRIAKIKTQDKTDAGKDVEKEEHPSTAVGVASWYKYSGN